MTSFHDQLNIGVRNVTLDGTNCDWLFNMPVKQLVGGLCPEKAAKNTFSIEGLAMQD